jgi:hypothetical protein
VTATANAPGWKPTIGKVIYDVERLPDGFAWRVARADGKAAYVVRREPGDRWECSCPAYRFGRADRRAGCKHVIMVRWMWQAMGFEDN